MFNILKINGVWEELLFVCNNSEDGQNSSY